MTSTINRLTKLVNQPLNLLIFQELGPQWCRFSLNLWKYGRASESILSGAGEKLLSILQLNVALRLIFLLCMAHPSIIWAGFEQHQKIITGESFPLSPLCRYFLRGGCDLQGFPSTTRVKSLCYYRFSIDWFLIIAQFVVLFMFA